MQMGDIVWWKGGFDGLNNHNARILDARVAEPMVSSW